MKVKKERYFALGAFVVLVVIFGVSFASAGIGDWFKQITGRATSDNADLNITIGNAAPTIYFVGLVNSTGSAVDGVSLNVTPTEDSTENFTVVFRVNDTDGVTNLNDSAPVVYAQRTSQTSRSNSTCLLSHDIDSYAAQYNCTVYMWYFDQSGTWTINATTSDINGAYNENASQSINYDELTSVLMAPTALTWTTLSLTSSNTGSNNDPLVINNTGNAESFQVNVTAIDLSGETTTTEFIYAGNFSVGNFSEGCTGAVTKMANATGLVIANSSLLRGNHSANDGSTGQEQVFFCINALNPGLSSQAYSTSGGGAWTVAVI